MAPSEDGVLITNASGRGLMDATLASVHSKKYHGTDQKGQNTAKLSQKLRRRTIIHTAYFGSVWPRHRALAVLRLP